MNKAKFEFPGSARLRLTEKTIEGLQFAKDSTVKVRVPLNGRPTPEVVWMREGVPILSSDRISFEQDELSATLTIANCTRADVGLYQIKAKNYIGSDEATFFVYVTGEIIVSPRSSPTVENA